MDKDGAIQYGTYRVKHKNPVKELHMRIKIISTLVVLVLLFFSLSAHAEMFLQGGFESYAGPNKLFNFTPWIGLRLSLSYNTSLLFKVYNHNIRFRFQSSETNHIQRNAHLTNFTTALFTQKDGNEFYTSVSYFTGSDSYDSLVVDMGTGIKIFEWATLETGIYLLREKSVLWYPDEDVRNILLYSIKGGFKFKIKKWLSIAPKIYLFENSEKVKSSTLSLSLIVMPKKPIFVTLTYLRYSESAQYKFSGNYFAIGLNFYY